MAMSPEKLAYHKAYREAHKEAYRAAFKRWYEKNGQASREQRVDAVREQARNYYHRSKDSDHAKEYAIANKDKKAAYHSDWQRDHRQDLNEYNRKRWLRTSSRYKGVTGIPESGPASNCEICGTDKNICMDHCHEVKVFRGWLCKTCNLRIGRPFGNSKYRERITEYLEKFQASRQMVHSDSR